MKVLNINSEQLNLVKDAVGEFEQNFVTALHHTENPGERYHIYQTLGQVETVREKLRDMSLQELAERCMDYFWERLKDGGVDEWPEVEALADDMGIEESELVSLFVEAGFEK